MVRCPVPPAARDPALSCYKGWVQRLSGWSNERVLTEERIALVACFTAGPVTATLMAKIIALLNVVAAAPAWACKDCAPAAQMNFRHCPSAWKETGLSW